MFMRREDIATAVRVGLALMVALLLAGCLGPGPAPPAPAPEAPVFGAPVRVLGCQEVRCYEPVLAARADGLVAVVSACGSAYAVSRDGGATFGPAPTPPPPRPPLTEWTTCDNVLQFDAQGRLFFTALVVAAGPAAVPLRSLAGMQVARSDDGGATWAANHHLALQQGTGGAFVADRPWLAVRGDDVIAGYYQVGVGIQVARSADGGSTFGAFSRAVASEERGLAGPSGPFAFGAGGALMFPYFGASGGAAGQADEVRVARSTDAGATWTQHRVAAVAPPEIPYWPFLTAAEDGAFVAAWSDAAGALWVATSGDGVAWGAPARWNPTGDFAWSPPWVHLGDEGHDVFWYARSGAGYTPQFLRARAPGEGSPVRFPTLPADAFPTDFAHAARLGDRALVAWAHVDEGVFVAAEVR